MKIKEIVLGTKNRHKADEILKLLADLPVKIKTLADFPQVADVEEDGATLEENAVKKAKIYAQATGLFALSDDTGLEIDALNGEPGVYSARYAGAACTFNDNIDKVLGALKNVPRPKRTAKFRTVIALSDGKNFLELAQGKIDGEILTEYRGKNGFGYDPVFYLPSAGKTLAEMTLDEKNRHSHRSRALENAKKILEKLCEKSES